MNDTFVFFAHADETKSYCYPKASLDNLEVTFPEGEKVVLDTEEKCQRAFGGGRYHTATLKPFFLGRDDQQIKARLWEGATYKGDQFNASVMVQAITVWDLDRFYHPGTSESLNLQTPLSITLDNLNHLPISLYQVLETAILGRYYGDDLPACFPTGKGAGGELPTPTGS